MRVISIDIGMNNFAAITNNIGKEPNLIRGEQTGTYHCKDELTV